MEFGCLLPTVAELVKQADEVKYVGDLSSNLNLSLYNSKDIILESAKVFEERNFTQVFSCMKRIVGKVDSYMD